MLDGVVGHADFESLHRRFVGVRDGIEECHNRLFLLIERAGDGLAEIVDFLRFLLHSIVVRLRGRQTLIIENQKNVGGVANFGGFSGQFRGRREFQFDDVRGGRGDDLSIVFSAHFRRSNGRCLIRR